MNIKVAANTVTYLPNYIRVFILRTCFPDDFPKCPWHFRLYKVSNITGLSFGGDLLVVDSYAKSI